MIQIEITNQSTVCSDAEITPIIAAIQKQITNDWYPAWGSAATLQVLPSGTSPSPTAWVVGIFDTSDQAGALGYHDVTPTGLPLGKIFAKSDKDSGYQVSVTCSHEILEMLADPDINLTAEVEDSSGNGRLYAYEVCDPVEADALGYQIDGVLVSDFVLPAYFQSFMPSGSRFAFKTTLPGPFTLAPGGYLSYKDERSSSGWQQQFAEVDTRTRALARPRVGSRRERRRTSRGLWITSEY